MGLPDAVVLPTLGAGPLPSALDGWLWGSAECVFKEKKRLHGNA